MDFLNLPATLCPAGLNIPPNPQYINRNSTAYETACGSTMVLPMLEHLEIVSSTIGPRENEKFQLALRQFLLSRTRLKVLDLSAISVDPLSVFAQKGMEEKHNWACTDLEVLAFKYSRMNRVYTDYEQHRVLLNSVYRQLRSLTKLRRLSIYCDVAIELHDPGMSQLKGSSELEDMSLVGTRWTREGIVKLLEAVPGLKVLRTYGDKEIVYRWLKDLERPDVKCE
ncbi:hypothetical protein FBU30_008047 [Linnemannia zychae]|nr:hypothetical protein FBU30_008047 [Linnemannia zychae]